MGANYDLILTPANVPSTLDRHIHDFLLTRGLRVEAVSDLVTARISGDKVILYSPPASCWLQVLGSCSAIGIELGTWFHCNPLAGYLSTQLAHCIHLWSLDSGFVAGYSIYTNGNKSECECVFSVHARSTREIIDGVPTPLSLPGQQLKSLLGHETDFASFIAQYEDLEIGVAALVARIGFKVHLVEYYNAIDDKQGSVIVGSNYEAIQLTGWTAIQFDNKAD